MLTDVLLTAGIAAFVIIRFVIEPKLRSWARTLKGGLNPGPAAIATQNATRFLGTFCGCLALGSAIAKGLTYWVESIDVATHSVQATHASLDHVSRLLETFQFLQMLLSKIGLATAIAPILLLGVGLLYWSIRSARFVDTAIEREIAELRKKAQSGALKELPADERMREVEKLIAMARGGKNESEHVETLHQLLRDLDIIRRVDPSMLRMTGLRADSGPFWLRALGYMISGTVFKGMARLALAVTVLANVSLIPASLILTSKGVSDAVAQVTRTLRDAKWNITLAVSPQNVDIGTDKILTNEAYFYPGAAAPLPDLEAWCDSDVQILSVNDCETAAQFGSSFEVRWPSKLIGRSGAIARRQVPFRQQPTSAGDEAEDLAVARREWSRREVLLESVRARVTPSVNIVESAPMDSGRWEMALLDAELTPHSTSRPVTRVGKNAEFRLREFLNVQPGGLAIEKQADPLTPAKLLGKAAASITGLIVDLSGAEAVLPGPEPAGKAVEEYAKKYFGDLVEKLAERRWEAESLASAVDRAAKAVILDATESGGRITSDGIVGSLERSVEPKTAERYTEIWRLATALDYGNVRRAGGGPYLTLEVPVGHGIDSTKIESALRKLITWTPLPADTLASYSSIFPGLEGQAARSLEAEMLHIFDPQAAEEQFGPRPNVTSEPLRELSKPLSRKGPELITLALSPGALPDLARASRARARSYSRLRGFARVGGVLIGRPPDEGPETFDLNLKGFTFSISSDDDPDLMLNLRHDNGAEVALGPYDPAIAHFALAYAADGRPTTVTIIKADPLLELKVLLHPALVDTGLGCRAIKLDMFIRDFGGLDSSDGPLRKQFVQETVGVRLYRLAWAIRYNAVRAKPDSQHIVDLKSWVATAEAMEALRNDLDAILQPLRERPAYFDKGLVEILDRCARAWANSLNADRLSACVQIEATKISELQRYRDSEQFTWPAPRPEIVTLFGVRERSYMLDRKLTFAQPPTKLRDGPLRFNVQNAFGTLAFLSKTDRPRYEVIGEGELGSELDLDSRSLWEFNFQGALQDTVLRGVEGRKEAESALYDMYEFTVLQRLFRAAFDGRLGNDFPIEQLTRLAKETAIYVNPIQIRTLRWDASPLKLKGVAEYRKVAEDLESTIRQDMDITRHLDENCLEALRMGKTDAPAAFQLECTLSTDVHNLLQPGLGDSPAFGKAKKFARRLNTLIVKLQLREALGVAADGHNSSIASDSCPSP